MTQESLARAAGFALNTLRNIERGRTTDPGIFTVSAIARVLEVDVCVFVRPSNAVTLLHTAQQEPVVKGK